MFVAILLFFSIYVSFFFQSLQPNRGATHLWKPMRAIHMLSCATRPKNVFLFSDGHISDEVSTLAMIQKYQQSVRLFTFGLRFAYLCFEIIYLLWERIFYAHSQWGFSVIKKLRYLSISIYWSLLINTSLKCSAISLVISTAKNFYLGDINVYR